MSQIYNPSSGGGSSGDVVGPSSSVDNDLVVFDGTTGKLIKDTGISSIHPSFSGDVTTGGNFNLPQTTTSVGTLSIGGARFLHAGGDASNTFVGASSGNRTNATIGNTGIGQITLQSIAGGISNTIVGHASGNALVNGSFNCSLGEGSLFNSGDLTGCVAIGWHTQISASGNYNVGIGYSVMTGGVSGTDNFGGGRACLGSLGAGNGNVAIGATSAQNITTGSNNTVLAYNALAGSFNTGSTNLILGTGSGNSYTAAESNNILLANSGVASENNTMRIGTSGSGTGQVNRAYVAGVNGVTVTGSAVLCATDGQLGTVVSSEKYKKDIQTLESSEILELRPVSFLYKNDETQFPQVGLIAEEVEKVIPRLCVYDNSGQLQSVKYHEIPTYLLLEIQKLNKRIEFLERELKYG